MRVLYFDCSAGAAGDMILGALVDAGASTETVSRELAQLGLDGWDLRFEEVTRGELRATRAIVRTEEQTRHRSYADIATILDHSSLSERVRELTQRTFQLVAEAEGRVHGIEPRDVTFHEVGALDSIIDIVGSCAAFTALQVDRAVTSEIALGRGTVEAQHGEIPLPAPAVTDLLVGAPVIERGRGETVTPTGAALLVAFTDSFGAMPPMLLEATGYGAGARDTDGANVIRVLLGQSLPVTEEGSRALLAETNIDDMNPELIPYVIDALIAAGAQDAWTTPIVMKKGRPSITLSVLFDVALEDRVLDVVYRETTTLGIRLTEVRKTMLEREWLEVTVEGHPLRVKVARRGGEPVTIAPEFEEAAAVARATGMALKDVYEAAAREARLSLGVPAPDAP
ncbi:MAG: nickel pincer cofactor biosynthesis protein LarC [Actinomycetota bacterium]|nr:nickel pincer cofactor biosynthesis protein LarC [Actinomycetota bacterium]